MLPAQLSDDVTGHVDLQPARLAFRAGSSAGHRFLVLLHTAAEPDVRTWRAYVEQVARELSASSELVHALVATDGGGPNAAQRRELAAVIQASQSDLLTHVFTSDRFVRGIVTAFRWIARAGAVAHIPADYSDVCGSCGLRNDDVRKVFVELQTAFPPVATLAAMLSPQRTTRASLRR